MKRLLLLSGLVLLALSFTSLAFATPSVIWSPQKSTEEVLIGGERQVTVQLNFLTSAKNVNLRVVPALSSVLSVSPDYIASVNAGATVPITLKFKVQSNAHEGLIEGVIQVKAGSKTLAKPLPVILNVVARPLRDIDNDGDGVWDDIQAVIDQQYGTEPDLRKGLRQYIMAMQEGILNASNSAASLTAATKLQRAIECLYALRGSASRTLRKELTASFLNSDYRSRAYLMFNEQLGGQVFPSTPSSDLMSSCQGQ